MPQRLTGFSPIVRNQVKERSGGLCEICGVFEPVQIHHRRPRGMGSTRREETNQAANALHLCNYDHSRVESDRSYALNLGWLVPQRRTPSEVPVLRRGQWVLLLNGGDFVAVPEPAGGRVA